MAELHAYYTQLLYNNIETMCISYKVQDILETHVGHLKCMHFTY